MVRSKTWSFRSHEYKDVETGNWRTKLKFFNLIKIQTLSATLWMKNFLNQMDQFFSWLVVRVKPLPNGCTKVRGYTMRKNSGHFAFNLSIDFMENLIQLSKCNDSSNWHLIIKIYIFLVISRPRIFVSYHRSKPSLI